MTTTITQTAGVSESCERLLARLNALGAGIKNIWIADSEFHSPTKSETGFYDSDGGLQVPVCFVFLNPITGEEIRQFYLPGEAYPPCPISLGAETLFVAYSAQAELMTMLRLWDKMPSRILDLEIEWRAFKNEEYALDQMKNEARAANKNKDGDLSPLSLLGVCALHGISTRGQEHKDEMRDLILRGGPWSQSESQQILDYCAANVYDTAALLAAFWTKIEDVPYGRSRITVDGLKAALHRGRMMQGFAWMRHVGIPIDVEMNDRLTKHFDSIMRELYKEIREEFPVFNDDSYDIAPLKWKEFLRVKGWLSNPKHPWAMTSGGKKKDKQPKRDVKRTIPAMALVYPELKKLATILEIRSATKLGLRFPVGSDGRHRVNFWCYGSVTGRCTPSSASFMLAGGSPAFRHLAKPKPGEILIEADWSAQEVWIAAYLSGDKAMQKMLQGADPYIGFGELCGMIPTGAMQTFIDEHGRESGVKLCKKRFADERAKLKTITLGVLYGKSVYTVASDCGITPREAAALLQMHRRTFRQFWIWSEWTTNEALATRKISTKFGWCRHLLSKKERDAHRADENRTKKVGNSLQNFPMQAGGAEMLRLACTYAAEIRLGVCAPLHDAIFVVANIEEEDKALGDLKYCMDRASRDLIGVAVPIEVFVTRYPERFVPDDKPLAITVWEKMMKALEAAEYEAERKERNEESIKEAVAV